MKSECVALLLVLSLCAGTWAATFYVDDDAPGDLVPYDPNYGDPQEDGSTEHPFDDIQEAIDAAVDGDTIIVAPGRYLSRDTWAYAELRFEGKSIRLISSAPTDFSMIEQTILCGVVIFHGTEDPNCLLQGFKIQNYTCGGILGNYTQANISHCIISGNGPCGATVLKDVRGRIANCLIVDNTTFHDCGVLPVVSGCLTLVNCTIANNLSGVGVTLVGLPASRSITIHNCIIYGNQGPQVYPLTDFSSGPVSVDYCLIEDWGIATMPPSLGGEYSIWSADPYFVRLGTWSDSPRGRLRPGDSSTTTTEHPNKALSEGDYHLQSKGWRPISRWDWRYDALTSWAIDAGDPMDSLGEELERAPGDPEGTYGFNHAIDLGAYGGTTQASLAPTEGEPPGVGAVDLRDYWPLNESNQWTVHNPQGTSRVISGSGGMLARTGWVYSLRTSSNAPDWVPRVDCYYTERTLYMTEFSVAYNQPLKPPEHVQAQYPQYLVAGATIQAPYDPFTKTPVEYRSVLIVRGTLAEVLAGTSVDPNQLVPGAWPDVIAFQGMNEAGTTGDPMAIFARGFGPLLLAGQPIKGARIGYRTFGTYKTPSTRIRTR
jgi:hypothetical protein